MKIFESDKLNCFIVPDKILKKKKNVISINHEDPGLFELLIRGMGRIIWPNREGEGFLVKDIYPALKRFGCLQTGLAISWPATASAEAVMIKTSASAAEADGCGFVFQAAKTVNTAEGLHRELRIFADGPESVRLRFSGSRADWRLTKVSGVILQDEASADAAASDPAPALQFQVGMIGPDGKTEAADGFAVLPELADRFIECFGPFAAAGNAFRPVIHVFGYAGGHDADYPDYSPSPRLGGIPGLTAAAEELHKRGFILSCYLNARIAEEWTLRRYPLLQSGICRDVSGTPVIEEYNGRKFNVMDPSFPPWHEHLFLQAMLLRECGADAVQLDQVSGRAPVVPSGFPWGAGYRSLIQQLQTAGLQVWIQGVSDYYPADWFEMTHRELSILPGGILRGGNPFGDTDLSLLRFLAGASKAQDAAQPRRYLVPLEKARALAVRCGSLAETGLPLIIDVMNTGEQLPLYGASYLDSISGRAAALEGIKKAGK